MTETLAYAPIMLYLLTSLIVFKARGKYSFTSELFTFLIFFAPHCYISYVRLEAQGLLIAGGQLLFAIIVFLVTVYVAGSKVSGYNLFVFSSTIALVPLFAGIWGYAGGILWIIGYSIYSLTKQSGRGLTSVALENAAITGVLTVSLPDFQSLPKRDEISGQKRMVVTPFFIVSFLLTAGVVFLVNL